MILSRTDRWFARFQRTRDPRLLAAVFDRTAAEILRVAQHLAPDAHAAEDLVQATFVTAIERADRYEPGLPVLPWLLGILANAARHERRQRARPLDARALRGAPEDPANQAAQIEFDGALREVLDQLGEPYRQVLLLHLEHGWSGRQIAELTGRKPATVRTQIARGLEMVRKALPAGFAAGTAVVAGSGRGLAAVRAAVFEQTGLGAVPTVGHTTLAGVLLMNKLAVVSVGLVLCGFAVVYVAAPTPRDLASTRPLVVVTEAELARPGGGSGPSGPGPREPVPPAAPASRSAAAAAAAGPESVEVVVRVVNAFGRPVADARVEAWAMPGTRPVRELDRWGSSVVRAGTQPWLATRTQSSGACTLVLDRGPLLLHAQHPEAGSSMDVTWNHLKLRVTLQVERLVPVSVLVLRADERPAPDMPVEVVLLGGRDEQPPPSAPVRTDRDGRCRFELGQGYTFGLVARDPTTRSFIERVRTTARTAALDVVVRFPGGRSVSGTLRDADGTGVAGEVVLWEQQTEAQRAADPMAAFHQKVTTGSEGRFRIDVPCTGRFDLIGAAKGHANSAVTSVDVAADSPHAHLDVQMMRATAITGSVTHADGTPWANAYLSAAAEGWEWSGYFTEIGPRDLFGEDPVHARTDAEGAFRLEALHPRAKYTVTCMPDSKRPVARLSQCHIVPDGTPVRFVISDADLRTGRIVGTVVSAATGKPVTRFKQWLLRYEDGRGQALSNELDVTDEQGAFRSEELGQGRQYALAFAADGLAPTIAGPVTISQAEHRFEVRLPETGVVAVRVLEADDTPAVHVEVHLRLLDGVPRNQGWSPQHTDEDGRMVWPKVALGRHVATIRRGEQTASAECVVRSGLTAEVELRLPQ